MSGPDRARRTTRRHDLPPPAARKPGDSTATVLRAILDHGPIARSSIARVTRLSAASVTGFVASLTEHGLVREAPEAAGPPGIGRPHVPLDIAADRVAVIGVHIAVEHTTVALLDLRGRVIVQRRDPHGRRHPADVIAAVADRIVALRRRYGQGGGRPKGGRRRILGIGVATGGWVDTGNGTVVEHPMLGWSDVRLGAELADLTGLPVEVDSNSRGLLRAEQLVGEVAARARESAVHLFVGNVVEVAFAVGGKVHRGPRSAAGVVAHLPVGGVAGGCPCGRTGCLQAAVSERALLRRAVAAGVIDRPELSMVLDAALGGREEAVALFQERARLIGRAVAALLDLFDPEVLVVCEPGVNRLPGCLAAVRAEAAGWSTGGASPDSGGTAGAAESVARVVRGSSFAGDVLAVAGGAVALDAVYAGPLSRADLFQTGA
ncbi:ROK family protein [Actinoplanes sp. URMC 104]|uniref:ROK family transcriptional regulator n=1 Tax=Actinoplanes sp. URMC 104 TaxID=3423409 RepID=UPI003F1A4686